MHVIEDIYTAATEGEIVKNLTYTQNKDEYSCDWSSDEVFYHQRKNLWVCDIVIDKAQLVQKN